MHREVWVDCFCSGFKDVPSDFVSCEKGGTAQIVSLRFTCQFLLAHSKIFLVMFRSQSFHCDVPMYDFL